MKNFKLFLLSAICLISFQSIVYAESFMSKAMKTWVGYPLDSVIKAWGYPDDERIIAGKHLYYWGTIPTVVTVYDNGSSSTPKYCQKIFAVDDSNIINDWDWKGNNCPFSYKLSKFLVNPKNDVWAIEKEKNRQEKEKRKAEKRLLSL